ncbi:MAG: protein kinase [Chloroflexi bacterium]|nr:protein kinase [Chloroflexota bacterium]
MTGEIIGLKRVLSTADHGRHRDNKTRLSLAQEFQILSGLRHPHIVSVLDYGFDEQRRPFFTMNLLAEAQTVVAAAQEQPLATCVHFVIQILQALTYLHRRGALHNDLKLANILVTVGQVKLLDFGVTIQVPGTSLPSLLE